MKSPAYIFKRWYKLDRAERCACACVWFLVPCGKMSELSKWNGKEKKIERKSKRLSWCRQSERQTKRTWNHYHVNANSIDSTSREMAKAIILIVNNFE